MPENVFYQHPKLAGLELRYGNDNRACYGLHTHSEYSLGAVLCGVASYQYRNQHYTLTQGDTVYIAPNIPHACNCQTPHGTWRYVMLYIDADYWQQCAHDATTINGKPNNNPMLFQALVQLHSTWHNNPEDILAIETAWLDCLQLLAQRKTDTTPSDTPPAALQQLLAWLDKHLTENFSLGEWAAAAHISRVQLLRLFRQQLHISPHQYCLNRRIQQAKILLKQGTPLDETAYELGFADQAHFQRTFKRYAAVTPLQYQRNR